MKLILILSLLVACDNPVSSSIGKSIYVSNCINCHGSNPNYAGAIGPDLVSTPKEVYFTKVNHGEYPANYKPKRSSAAMPMFDYSEIELDAVFEYIQSFKRK